jgi:hypothetical protein
MPPTPPPLIDAELAAFMQLGVSITVGSCGADNRPSVVRGSGCRVADDGATVRVFVSLAQAAPLLAHVRATGRVAAVFSKPSNHRTLQLKGRNTTVEPLAAGDAAVIERYRDAFVAELRQQGYAPALARALHTAAFADMAALRFTPVEAYSQTPGPDAGRALQAGA